MGKIHTLMYEQKLDNNRRIERGEKEVSVATFFSVSESNIQWRCRWEKLMIGEKQLIFLVCERRWDKMASSQYQVVFSPYILIEGVGFAGC